jgi:hypothetical protein
MQQAADAGGHLARVERLCHVVIRLDLQPDDAIGFVSERRQKNHRNVAVGPQSAAKLEPVGAW